ncbi:probable LRR receptor-like serine/threonine-protein kinase At1g06840 [Aristolochia californica]|uniref:probable LRR receptor-like serine/threonine-protein kinase At1g06840 n=1 Tax=Aristolochia californica TaxID=171875 RepID=UPI0035D7BC9B
MDDDTTKVKEPSFQMRLQIALGSTKGILYLHTEANPPIFHRDIKASNILLDSKFTAKVANFGLSRLVLVTDVEGAVPGHVSTIVKGTPGYLDPEYFLTHKLTDKSDVYNLGIENISTQARFPGLVFIKLKHLQGTHVSMAYRSGLMSLIIDSRQGSYSSECIEPFLNLALRCCQDETDS